MFVFPMPPKVTTPVRWCQKHHRTGDLSRSGQNDNQTWSKEIFAQFIRARLPHSPEYHLAQITGIPATTARKHINGETRPCADHVLAYLAAFGPELLVAMNQAGGGWMERAAHAEKKRQLRIQAREAGEQIAELDRSMPTGAMRR